MIRSTIYTNALCLKCDCIKKYMVKIGAFIMCPKCFEDEFNTDKINPDSVKGRKYYKWLKIYNEKIIE